MEMPDVIANRIFSDVNKLSMLFEPGQRVALENGRYANVLRDSGGDLVRIQVFPITIFENATDLVMDINRDSIAREIMTEEKAIEICAMEIPVAISYLLSMNAIEIDEFGVKEYRVDGYIFYQRYETSIRLTFDC